MKTINNFKRGDTFTLTCTYKVNGSAVSVDNIDIESQIRTNSGVLITDLIVTKTINLGEFILTSAVADTSTWQVAVVSCDIQLSEGGSIRSSETFSIVVSDDVTK